MPTISVEQLSSWPSKRLLGRLNALRRLHESPGQSDMTADEIGASRDIQFKSDPRWNTAYEELKLLLDGREHIRSGKTARQARAKARKR